MACFVFLFCNFFTLILLHQFRVITKNYENNCENGYTWGTRYHLPRAPNCSRKQFDCVDSREERKETCLVLRPKNSRLSFRVERERDVEMIPLSSTPSRSSILFPFVSL